MLTDLFSSLDGANSVLNWFLPILMSLLLLHRMCWLGANISGASNSLAMIWGTTPNKRFNGFMALSVGLFAFLLVNNVLGLTPFTYSLTSNLFTVSSLALLLWFGLLLSGFCWSPKQSLAHLVPSGAPGPLLPVLVIIETISLLIRPITLTVRLIANMSAGHVVLGLLANVLTFTLHSTLIPLMLLICVGYTLFEFFVSAIQAYIFTLLTTLYCAEHP